MEGPDKALWAQIWALEPSQEGPGGALWGPRPSRPCRGFAKKNKWSIKLWKLIRIDVRFDCKFRLPEAQFIYSSQEKVVNVGHQKNLVKKKTKNNK